MKSKMAKRAQWLRCLTTVVRRISPSYSGPCAMSAVRLQESKSTFDSSFLFHFRALFDDENLFSPKE
ncbi:hypothetical protein DASC09_055020 [Saccharomycopsis crataegensis]|uniref:Secreted protein n=1 Tax=Saccharomycopsis crataegensis TaxID=43959 RepID=A0AAV5QTC4_9ASCO|nr:hypothetical protein DASC09_055020 [Saccharomycopsis crataegensis]